MTETGKGMPASQSRAPSPRKRPKRRAPAPLYAFGVATLAVFLSGLLVLPPTPSLYVARVTLAGAKAMDLGDGELAETVRSRLATDEVLREALKGLGPPPGVPAAYAENWPPYSEVERLRATVRIEPVASNDSAAPQRVNIVAVAADRKRALALAEQLAAAAVGSVAGGGAPPDAAAVASANPSIDPELAAQLERLRGQEQEARGKLDAFLKDLFQSVRRKSQKGGNHSAAQRSIEPRLVPREVQAQVGGYGDGVSSQYRLLSGTEEVAAGGHENPEWIRLQIELGLRTDERLRLLQRLQPAHPQVQAVDAEIEQIRQRIADTPHYLNRNTSPPASQPQENPTPGDTSPSETNTTDFNPAAVPSQPSEPAQRPNASSASGAGAKPKQPEQPSTTQARPGRPSQSRPPAQSGTPAEPTVDPELAARAAEYETLRREYDQARERLAEAEAVAQQFRAATAQTQGSVPQAALSQGGALRIAEPPQIVVRQGGAPSSSGLLLLGLFSIVAGAGTAWACRGAGETSGALETAEQVGQELGLPVVGEICRAATPPKPRGAVRRRIAAQAVRAAELLLAVFLVAFLLLAILDSPLMSQALQSPLGAVSQIMQRVTKLF